jgi:hypothetical protein
MPSRPCPFPRCWTCSFTFSNGWQVEDYFLKILSALLTLFLFLCYKWNSTRLQCSSCREYAPTGCALFKFFLGCVFFKITVLRNNSNFFLNRLWIFSSPWNGVNLTEWMIS